jgi:uncharacterized iron-regulated membrane protein
MNTQSPVQHSARAVLHRLFWRLHFWSGLLTAPIVLLAALTGILYIFTPQIEAVRHAELDRVTDIRPPLPLDQQIAAARAAVPDLPLKAIIPAYTPGETTRVLFGEKPMRGMPKPAMPPANTSANADPHAPHQHHTPTPTPAKAGSHTEHNGASKEITSYIDPGAAKVQGNLPDAERFKNWSRKLHSSLLQGDGWRWLIELGASWMLIMMLTGFYLWWPRGRGGWRAALLPAARNTKGYSRNSWRYWHSITSVVLAVLTLTILLTGLTWSKYTGDNFRAMQQATGQNTPRAPRDLTSVVTEGKQPLSTEQIYVLAKSQVPAIRLRMNPPEHANGVWRIENDDRSQPEKRFQLVLDAYNGQRLFYSGWDQMPLLSKATAVGIPFHRGEFGWWNQALLLAIGCSAIFSVMSGYVMWWQRRRPATLSAPSMHTSHVRSLPLWLLPVAAILGYSMPVFGISLLLMLTAEAAYLLLVRQQKT